MADYYRDYFYGLNRFNPLPNAIEYPGYNNNWHLGRQLVAPTYYDQYDYQSPNYASSQYYPRSGFEIYPQSHRGQSAQLSWPTEIPVRLRVSLCCDGCKMKLDKILRDTEGVHDVGIQGWRNAMVTVTGIASSRKILKQARKIKQSTEFWNDSHHEADYSKGQSYYSGYR